MCRSSVYWVRVGRGPALLAVGVDGDCLDNFGLNLACKAKGLSCHTKNQSLPKHLRKKTSKGAKYCLPLRYKNDPLK